MTVSNGLFTDFLSTIYWLTATSRNFHPNIQITTLWKGPNNYLLRLDRNATFPSPNNKIRTSSIKFSFFMGNRFLTLPSIRQWCLPKRYISHANFTFSTILLYWVRQRKWSVSGNKSFIQKSESMSLVSYRTKKTQSTSKTFWSCVVFTNVFISSYRIREQDWKFTI